MLRELSLTVPAGQIVALLGSNGAGKSTLNNTVCGICPAFGGQVSFDGHDITRAKQTAIVAAGLIQVPEGRRVFPNLSVLENLELGSYRRGRANRGKNLGRVSLNPIRHIDPFGTLLLPAVLWFATKGQVVFGYAKPVPYNPYVLRNPSLGSAAIAAAGRRKVIEQVKMPVVNRTVA